MRTRRRGARSASAAPPPRAAMSAWASTRAIRGRRRSAMLDALETPRAVDGRAPDVFRSGAWVKMRCHADAEEVDFAIVGTGAGGGTLACKLAEAGFSVVAFDAGPFWRPLDDFASDEKAQGGLYWTDERITGGADPVELGSNNSGRGGGGGAGGQTRVPRP